MNHKCLVPDCTNIVSSLDSYYCSYHKPKPSLDPKVIDTIKEALSEGRKDDQGKLPMTLISPSAMRKLAKILQLGAAKYSRRNWEKGISFSRVADALQRHFDDWREEIEQGNPDPESNESHIFHVLCNAMFLSHFMAHYDKYKEFDDRQK